MYMLISPAFQKNKIVADITATIFFGSLSAILGMVQFKVQGLEGIYSDLREIPLLISLFYLRNPIFILFISMITALVIPDEAPYLVVVLFHYIPLTVIWLLYTNIIQVRKFNNLVLGGIWVVVTLIYYLALLFPILILLYKLLGLTQHETFLESYASIVKTSLFEIITTSQVTSLYLIQREIRNSLEYTNENLENLVSQRTLELSSANKQLQLLNEELYASNEGTRSLNENLERLVKDRTEKINEQLSQLRKYAFMNSHEVRAPLARILGLLLLLKKEADEEQRQQLLDKLYVSSEQLDDVIRRMNRLLENEIENVNE